MRRHTFSIALTICIIVGACVGCSRKEEDKGKKAPVRIGAVLPLTGSTANYGELMRRGILLAVADQTANSSKSNNSFDVIIEDSRSNPKDGVSAFQKLIAVDKVPAAMPALSSIILGCVPIAEQQRVVVLNCPANSPKLRGAGKFVFNIYILSDQESKYIADYAFNTMGARTAGILFVNNDSGRGYKDSFTSSFSSLGGIIREVEGHEQGATDFRTYVEKFRNADVDLIFLCSYYAESALFLKQAKELGYQTKWLSYSSVETPDFLKLAGAAAEGLVYSQPGFDLNSNDDLTKRFVAEYKSRYGQEPDLWSAQYYDGTRLLAAAIASGAQNGEEIQAYLSKVRDFAGITGPITFDAQGCITREVRFKVIRNGGFLPMEK